MVESKKALPKEPRLGYYNGYGPGPIPFGPFSQQGPPRYPSGMYGSGGHYPYAGGPRGYGHVGHYGGYPHHYSGYDRDHWMHEQYGGPNYNNAYYNNHRSITNSNANLDSSFSSGGGTYGYDHNTEMKYYHSSPQQDNKYSSSTNDRQNGNLSNLMPGSYSHRIKGSSDEIGSNLESSFNNTSFNSRFNNSLEDTFPRGEQQNKRGREYLVSQALESNQQGNNSFDRSYEAYIREESKYLNGHNFTTEGVNHNSHTSGNPTGGNMNNLGYSSRSLQGSSFGSLTRRPLYESPNNAPYSSSAGSGGSAENSASSHGYEDDFPELSSVGSKFNNLRLDTDQLEALTSGNNISAVGNPINTMADTNPNEISTIEQLKQAINDQNSISALNNSNGHTSLSDQGASRFVSF